MRKEIDHDTWNRIYKFFNRGSLVTGEMRKLSDSDIDTINIKLLMIDDILNDTIKPLFVDAKREFGQFKPDWD